MTNATTTNAAETIDVLKYTVWGLLDMASKGTLTGDRAEIFKEQFEAVMLKEEMVLVANDITDTLNKMYLDDLRRS